MEQDTYLPSPSRNYEFSSSIDLTRTTAGLATSQPPSPSLDPSDARSSFARRRTSWGNRLVDPGQDPLRLDSSSDVPPVPGRIFAAPARPGESSMSDDPFYSPTDDRSSSVTFNPEYPFASESVRYGRQHSDPAAYSTSQAGPSTASLIEPPPDESEYDGHREDDEAHLTANMSRSGIDERWGSEDPEMDGQTPRRRRTVRYSVSPSPLKKTGTAIRNVSQNLRRVSLRVVNLAGSGLETQLRLGDGETTGRSKKDEGEESEEEEEYMQELSKKMPLRGRTLGFLGPENKVRLALYGFLVHPWTEPTILVLIILNAVVLTIQAFPSITLPMDDDGVPMLPPKIKGYFHEWEDWVLFVLFIIFTLEALARICVTGFLFDPDIRIGSLFSLSRRTETYTATADTSSNLTRGTSLSRARSITHRLRRLQSTLMRPFALHERHPRTGASTGNMTESAKRNATRTRIDARPNKSTFFSQVLKSDNPADSIALPFRLSIEHLHSKTKRNVPYLRHSWSRIDFGYECYSDCEVVDYYEWYYDDYAFAENCPTTSYERGVLRAFRYGPLSIIGVQSFKGSLRRTCVLQPVQGVDEIFLDEQFCGGYIDPTTMLETGYMPLNGVSGSEPKGYICPLGQVCKELSSNPEQNLESFDAIYYSALQVIIVATANGWSPLMYSMMDAEFFISCVFFILAIIVLNFWLINLFVAVITNTFSAIRSETKKSAFGAAALVPLDGKKDWDEETDLRPSAPNVAKTIYEYTRWCWVLLALASLALQASREVDITESHSQLLYYGELGITIAFDVEIVIRMLAVLPEWRTFFKYGQNWLDTFLAVGCSVIQIPAIQRSAVYPWLTILQLMRFYRVILEVPRMRPLLLAVFGNMYGLANMSLFLILINYLAALVAVQFLRGDFGVDNTVNFGELWNSFITIYTVFSSENWTNVLYGSATTEVPLGQTIICLVFFSAWMLFANFIVLQMFIAVINENFEVAEEAKKGKQASNYLAAQKARVGEVSWFRRLNPYRWVKANPNTIKVENLPANLVLPVQKSMVQAYTVPRPGVQPAGKPAAANTRFRPRHYTNKSLTALQKLFAGELKSDDMPMQTLRHARQETLGHQDEEVERHLELLASVNTELANGEDPDDIIYERRAQKADFIRDHPTYDKAFWVISQKNIIRRMCQKLVHPPRGDRIFGTAPSPIAHPVFQLTLLLTIIGGIVVEGIATPLYRRTYYLEHGLVRGSWFDIAEAAFGFTLFLEFLIKIVADGFAFTPNAYIRSIWNIFDFFIMIGIIVNVSTGLVFVGGLSRFTRSLKALRALRLITLIDQMRYTFQSLIISGALRIMDAAILAILYMIPYAVWGLNIFSGKMNMCNDTSDTILSISDCIYEYENNVAGNDFSFPVPRMWDNPSPSTQFSFDTFRSSLLILFEIVSLEGWVDVMGVATSITGQNQQPQTNVSQENAIFFLIYNLLGAVVILTLFVSIIIGNFSSKTGSAFLTQPQREWIDLQKLFKRQKPSKRPSVRPPSKIRSWCYDRAIQKHGWWSRMMTMFFIIHIIMLMSQSFSTHRVADTFRNDFFLALMFIYLIDVIVRLYGLGWKSFHANGWNMFDIIAATGSFITTFIVRFGSSGFVTQQLQKLFLVSIAFKLIQRTNSLNMLFKTAVASLPVILSLLGLWLILFMFFGILFLEVFGLTKWGGAETRNQNYYSLGSSLVMLTFQSTGEGWNQYMHDFDLTYPRCTNSPTDEAGSDCGSTGWAFSLFIAWNLLSMYIFVNMFTGVVVENFSYVFQASGSGAKSISREQMRAFKKVWAEFSNQKTGYLEKPKFAAFFQRLSGAFEVRIYPADYSIPNILLECSDGTEKSDIFPVGRKRTGIDFGKLERVLDSIDYSFIRKRRAVYTRLYHEAMIIHQQNKGIGFADMLMLLAHHKLIVDAEALVLKDLVIRTETNKLVTDLVNLDRVQSLLKTIYLRKRFLTHLEQKRNAEQEIPSIIVDVHPETPPSSSRDIATAGLYDRSPTGSPEMRFTGDPSHGAAVSARYSDTFRSHSIPPIGGNHSFNLSISDVFTADISSSTLKRSSRRYSDNSIYSAGTTISPRHSFVEEDPQVVLSSMQHSAWGDLMIEAAEEEHGKTNF
ncbi:Ion transport protein-domain-containing protein [Cyathus striatus]|nr:Ion transport protein-domain-containing protein [Cyathus striatus]